MSEDDIGCIEEGGTGPTVALLRRLAAALDADVRLTLALGSLALDMDGSIMSDCRRLRHPMNVPLAPDLSDGGMSAATANSGKPTRDVQRYFRESARIYTCSVDLSLHSTV
jgi:hypothetical protein